MSVILVSPREMKRIKTSFMEESIHWVDISHIYFKEKGTLHYAKTFFGPVNLYKFLKWNMLE